MYLPQAPLEREVPAQPFAPAYAPSLAPASGVRDVLAALLRAASALLDRLAAQLTAADSRSASADPVFEFYAEAGAPEGALYLDGQLVGIVEGVTRL